MDKTNIGSKVIVGIPQRPTAPFVESALTLAEKLKKQISFVHAIEPWQSTFTVYPGEPYAINVFELQERERIDSVRKDLLEQLEPYQKKVNFDVQVRLGRPADVLIGEATSQGASYIISAVNELSHKFVPTGFSTALSLLADTPIPTIILPKSFEFKGDKEHVNILVNDDLASNHHSLLASCIDLSKHYKSSEIVHYHCFPRTKEQLESWAKDHEQVVLANDLERHDALDPSGIISETEVQVKEALNARISNISSKVFERYRISYDLRVDFGDYRELLAQVNEMVDPDFLVFGRHHFIKTKPFAIGKMPFYAMLNFGRPILMIPSKPLGA
ncbi:MAG: universal stress protein [Pseudobacteriovorax sp.]|nr:universal stress protein [Pseudobacteriovorax sp.]